MATANIQRRRNIHAEQDIAATTANKTTHHDSQEKLSDCSESRDENLTQDPEESLAKQSIQTDEFKGRNKSDIKNNSNKLNDSEKRVERTLSPRRQNKVLGLPHSSSMTKETAIGFDQPPSSVNRIKLFVAFSIPIAIFVILYFLRSNPDLKHECPFSKLKEKYQKEGDYLWNHLQIGNENILNKKRDTPAVFLFVHHGGQIAETLIKDIADTSAHCFGTSNTKTIDFTSEKVKEDYGYVIEAYKNSIKEGNVVLIANLNKIPGEAAKALHAICDTVSPIVKKVIILLSLTVEQKNSEEKVIDIAENALKQLWQDKMGSNELDPIIARVTDQVLLLQSN